MKSKSIKKFFAVLSAVLFIFAYAVPITSAQAAEEMLIPGGMAFGVKFFTKGAIVLGVTGVETASGIKTPAKDAGIQAGDIITAAGGQEFDSAEELIDFISGSGGTDVMITYSRDGEEKTVKVTPERDIESSEFRIGIFVKDSTAGIGTVTYIDPETLDFGGLGHGIYDSETGTLLPLGRGAVVDIEITDVIKSEPNYPGELRGSFGRTLRGELWDNSDEGVFGRFNRLPSGAGEPIPVADKRDIVEGGAEILTTLSGSEIGRYEIEIERIFSASGSTKNFLLRVTDPKLIEKTGGIVQGMSGSPIIQNGRLIGAVTHV